MLVMFSSGACDIKVLVELFISEDVTCFRSSEHLQFRFRLEHSTGGVKVRALTMLVWGEWSGGEFVCASVR